MSGRLQSRRQFLVAAGTSAGAVVLAACQPKIVEVEKIVEKQVTTVVKETVVVKEAVEVQQEVTRVVEKVVEAKAAPGEKITLRVQTRGGPAGEYGRHFAAKFDEEHPNITVKAEDTIYAELLKKQELGFVSGTMTDTAYSGTKWYDYACYKGMYAAIDAHVNANPYHFDDYYPGLIEGCKFDGKLYGLPGDAHPHARELLVWNRDLIDGSGLPWPPDKGLSMEDWKETALATTDPDNGIFGTRHSAHVYYDFDCCVLMPFGARLLNADGSKLLLMDDPKTADAVKWYLGMVDAHATPYRDDLLESGDMFFAGKLATNNTGLSGLIGIDKATEGGTLWEWDWTLMPAGPAGRGSQVFINQWCVTSGSKHPAEAYEMISYLTSAEVGIWATVNMHKQPNGSRTAWNSKEVAEVEPAFAACAPWYEEDLVRFPMPHNLRYAEFQDTWNNLSQPLFYGEKSWDEQAPIIQEKCQAILDMPLP